MNQTKSLQEEEQLLKIYRDIRVYLKGLDKYLLNPSNRYGTDFVNTIQFFRRFSEALTNEIRTQNLTNIDMPSEEDYGYLRVSNLDFKNAREAGEYPPRHKTGRNIINYKRIWKNGVEDGVPIYSLKYLYKTYIRAFKNFIQGLAILTSIKYTYQEDKGFGEFVTHTVEVPLNGLKRAVFVNGSSIPGYDKVAWMIKLWAPNPILPKNSSFSKMFSKTRKNNSPTLPPPVNDIDSLIKPTPSQPELSQQSIGIKPIDTETKVKVNAILKRAGQSTIFTNGTNMSLSSQPIEVIEGMVDQAEQPVMAQPPKKVPLIVRRSIKPPPKPQIAGRSRRTKRKAHKTRRRR